MPSLLRPFVWLPLALGLVACGGGGGLSVESPAMAAIRSRGMLLCGVEGTMPGFSRVEKSGRYTGLDVDICRATAAALLGDGEKVEFHNLSAGERFAALSSGQVDLLSRNTTLTLGRDATGGNGLSFGPIVFHDGQGFLVPTATGVTHPDQLGGKPICVVTGTTTELNLADWMRSKGIAYTALKFQSHDQSYAAYLQGRCAAVTSNLALLASRRSTFTNPSDHLLLAEVISKEPNAPATRQNDPALADAQRWIIYALMQAEEMGITRQNLQQKLAQAKADPTRAELRRFLGVDGDYGRALGLPADFVVRVVSTVGNYGEIFDRNLGPASPLRLERGPNRLWTKGGLIMSPPFR